MFHFLKAVSDLFAASDTLLFPGMFRADGMGVAPMNDDAESSDLQFDAAEAYPQFLEFYKDVHEEMCKFGRIRNFKVRLTDAAHRVGN